MRKLLMLSSVALVSLAVAGAALAAAPTITTRTFSVTTPDPNEVALVLVGATASAATATAPNTDVIPINFSFTPPLLSSACGFVVTRHVQGTLTIRTFYDAQGNFVRELDQYNLVETVSANGNTLVARTVQNITVKLLPDGFYTVAFVGSDFRLRVPGAGIAFGSVGRLVLLFAADNTLLDVQQDVGNVQANFTAICQALAAP